MLEATAVNSQLWRVNMSKAEQQYNRSIFFGHINLITFTQIEGGVR
jgi:hypothetical protein